MELEQSDEMSIITDLQKLFVRLSRFAATSLIATLVDYFLYLFLVVHLVPVVSQLISSGVGMIINYFLQKRFVFQGGSRSDRMAFLLSIVFSLVGIGLGAGMVYLLNFIPFFQETQWVTKAIVIGLVFFYNYATKKIAFGV